MTFAVPTEEEAAAIFAVLTAQAQPQARERSQRLPSAWRLAARDPELTFDDIRAQTRATGVR